MRIVALSDTHMQHERLVVPGGDLLIHAGDATMHGGAGDVFATYAWLSMQPHERIVFVPGNHDFGFVSDPDFEGELARRWPRVTTLLDEPATVAGHSIWGSPWQPWFHDWAFNFAPEPGGATQARDKWAEIPNNVEILVTHGPMRGVLDEATLGGHVGCPHLSERIAQLGRLRLHVFGHIHEAYGSASVGSVLHVNAASCDLRYRATHRPIVVDLGSDGARVAPARTF